MDAASGLKFAHLDPQQLADLRKPIEPNSLARNREGQAKMRPRYAVADIDTTQRVVPRVERAATTFSSSMLPATAAALSDPTHRLVLKLVAALESRHDDDGPVDRLLIRVFPEFSPLMVAHYVNGKPPLAGLVSPQKLAALDEQLALFVRALALVPNLRSIVRQVARDELEADDQFAWLLSHFRP